MRGGMRAHARVRGWVGVAVGKKIQEYLLARPAPRIGLAASPVAEMYPPPPPLLPPFSQV